MNVYKAACRPIKRAFNGYIHFTIVANNIYDAEDMLKKHIEDKDLNFIYIMQSSQRVLIETGQRSDFTIRNCDNVPQYVEARRYV